MARPLKRYDVMIDGNRTTVKLTEEEAKRRGLVETRKRTAPNKARTVEAVETKGDDEQHVCPACGFEAKSAGGLAAHQRSHED